MPRSAAQIEIAPLVLDEDAFRDVYKQALRFKVCGPKDVADTMVNALIGMWAGSREQQTQIRNEMAQTLAKEPDIRAVLRDVLALAESVAFVKESVQRTTGMQFREEEIGGALDAAGNVVSDADPSL